MATGCHPDAMKRLTATASLAALLVLAGCSSAPASPVPAGSSEADAATAGESVASATDPTAAVAAGAPLGDPCALLTSDEVAGVLPGSAAGEPTVVASADAGQCLWMDSATGKWIELGIGPVGTGPGATSWDEADAMWVFDLGGVGLAGRGGTLKYVDFSTGDPYQQQLEPLVAAVQTRF